MNVIDKFIKQYENQYEFHRELGHITKMILERKLEEHGIKAIVSFRAKTPSRLRSKVNARNIKKKYKYVGEISSDIVDLTGVRIALYFPSDRSLIDEIVKDVFRIHASKEFPNDSFSPRYSKRFSGYWATHYRVTLLKSEGIEERFSKTLFEIQVASVLMHAWAEVEHHLVYKPESGKISEDEYSILDEINGLVIASEIALERLQRSMSERTRESNHFKNQYDLTNYIINSLNVNYLKKLKLGNTFLIATFLSNIADYPLNEFNDYLKRVNQSVKEPISDQLLYMMVEDYFKDDFSNRSVTKYLKKVFRDTEDFQDYESSIKIWAVAESAIRFINKKRRIFTKKYTAVRFDVIMDFQILSDKELADMIYAHELRNDLLHGTVVPDLKKLRQSNKKLISISQKLIDKLGDEGKTQKLTAELQTLRPYA